MATDMGVLILSPEGRLRRDAASIFQYVISKQNMPAANKSGGTEINVAHLQENLLDFGVSAFESELIVAMVLSKGVPVTLDVFTDAFMVSKGPPASAGLDLHADSVHFYINQQHEPLSNFYPCHPP